MKIKEDARVIKTKDNLISTFEKLLSEKKFENITVNEICERADIRRATFYKHFEDKYDFLSYFIRTLRVKFDTKGKYGAPDGTIGYYVEYAHEIIEFLDENEKILKNILESEIAGSIINVIVIENIKETKDKLKSSVEKGLKLPASVDTVADMLVGGVAVVVLNWFTNDKPTPKEILLREITAIIEMAENKQSRA
ncbi:MAG: TetR family transcriptional regulator [Clostridia bacterium]|nr:TetR family transcriptional regulator [Clostridia bacterium]